MEIKNQNQLKKKRQRQKKPDEIQKPSWVKLNRNDFDSLTQDVYKYLNNDESKTTVDKKTYDLKNVKKFLVKITTQKITEKEALNLYSDLTTPDITVLEKTKGKSKDRRNNILNVLNNLESVFTGVYLNYFDKPSESEESIAERTKLRRQRSDEIAKKEKMIDPESFREYFEYSSPSHMYKNLNKTIGSQENKAQVSVIEDGLANLMTEFKSKPTSDAKKLEAGITCCKLWNLFLSLID